MTEVYVADAPSITNEAETRIDSRPLLVGLTKLVFGLTIVLLLLAYVAARIVQGEGEISSVAISALIIALALSILTTGFRALLDIYDWFAARREVKNG